MRQYVGTWPLRGDCDMGSGPKFSVDFHKHFSLGISVSRWPHDWSILLSLVFVTIYFGIGKGYDEV